MKRLSVSVFILMICAGVSFAATTSNNKANFIASHPQTHQINVRVLDQKRAVQLAISQKKLTQAQITTFYENLKSVHQLEAGFIKGNNRQDLTTDQANQITTLLNQNQQLLSSVGVSEVPTPQAH